NATSTSNDVVRALCLLKDIKQSTRETFLDAEGYRRRVAEQKDLVEAHHLKLQNLLYEKDHLLREIRRCKGYPASTTSSPIEKRKKFAVHHVHAFTRIPPFPGSISARIFDLPTTAGPHHRGRMNPFVVFMYLPQLRVVVVEAPRYPALLRNLFATDSGTDFPNQPAIAYAFEASDGMEVPMAFPTDVKARPYVWAQWITGLSSTGRIEPSIRHVMARHALYGHLDALKEKRVDLSPSSELASASVKTKLHSWSKVARDDISVFPDYVDGTLYFRASLVPPGGTPSNAHAIVDTFRWV
ncbi:hypothetical protein DYB32_010537, partial [Aphanomyces invadans]